MRHYNPYRNTEISHAFVLQAYEEADQKYLKDPKKGFAYICYLVERLFALHPDYGDRVPAYLYGPFVHFVQDEKDDEELQQSSIAYWLAGVDMQKWADRIQAKGGPDSVFEYIIQMITDGSGMTYAQYEKFLNDRTKIKKKHLFHLALFSHLRKDWGCQNVNPDFLKIALSGYLHETNLFPDPDDDSEFERMIGRQINYSGPYYEGWGQKVVIELAFEQDDDFLSLLEDGLASDIDIDWLIDYVLKDPEVYKPRLDFLLEHMHDTDFSGNQFLLERIEPIFEDILHLADQYKDEDEEDEDVVHVGDKKYARDVFWAKYHIQTFLNNQGYKQPNLKIAKLEFDRCLSLLERNWEVGEKYVDAKKEQFISWETSMQEKLKAEEKRKEAERIRQEAEQIYQKLDSDTFFNRIYITIEVLSFLSCFVVDRDYLAISINVLCILFILKSFMEKYLTKCKLKSYIKKHPGDCHNDALLEIAKNVN